MIPQEYLCYSKLELQSEIHVTTILETRRYAVIFFFSFLSLSLLQLVPHQFSLNSYQPVGRPIPVETGSGDRLPSIDTRRPRLHDTDAIIEVKKYLFVDLKYYVACVPYKR